MVLIFVAENYLTTQGENLKGLALKIETFSGPEMATGETLVHKITCFLYGTFDGGKSITWVIGGGFSGPTLSDGPCNGFARIKIITSLAR
jgi:hypothetical protein